jgi:beta-xylosidase
MNYLRNDLLLACLLLLANLTAWTAEKEKLNTNKTIHTVEYNPIIPDYLADPSLVMFGDTFYMYATTDIDQGLDKMGIPVVWKTSDFVNWSFCGNILPSVNWDKPYSYVDGKGKDRTGYFRYWAPGKPIYKDGKYYLFPTIVTPDEQMGTYVVVANEPNGPFRFLNGEGLFFNDTAQTARQSVPLVPDSDGEPFVDDDGQMYIYWRRRFAAKVSGDLHSLVGDTISIPTKYSGYSEGPVLFKRKGIYYYVYTLSGHSNYCNGYMISRHSPLGPWEEPAGNNIFIHSSIERGVWGPGHGNVFQMPDTDDFYFLYLEYGEGGTTRQVFANKMEFNPDGTIVPIVVDKQGVGALGKTPQTKKNMAFHAIVSSSSHKESKTIKAQIIPDPNKLKNLRVNTREGDWVEQTFTYHAKNAADGSNGTRWWAADNDKSPWLMLDFGKSTQVNEVKIWFINPTFGHSWRLEKSKDGKKWTTCAQKDEPELCAPQNAFNVGKTRFLRLNITDGKAGIYEIKVY